MTILLTGASSAGAPSKEIKFSSASAAREVISLPRIHQTTEQIAQDVREDFLNNWQSVKIVLDSSENKGFLPIDQTLQLAREYQIKDFFVYIVDHAPVTLETAVSLFPRKGIKRLDRLAKWANKIVSKDGFDFDKDIRVLNWIYDKAAAVMGSLPAGQR